MVAIPLSSVTRLAPFNIETNFEFAIVNSLNDPTMQHRVRISTASMSGVQPSGLPWAKAMNTNSQITNGSQSSAQGGSTMTSTHSLKPGDIIMVQRPTSSGQDWIIIGHPGTILGSGSNPQGAAASGFSNGPQNFIFNLLHIQDAQRTKPKNQSTNVPADGTPTWTNPTGSTVQQSSQPDPRQYYNQMAQSYSTPSLYQPNIFKQGMHIITSPATGSPITQVIQQMDQTFMREAQQNSNALGILHRLRLQLNTSDMNGFTPNNQQGIIQTVQQLLSGGGGIPGIGNIASMLTNLFGAFNGMGAATSALGPLLNAAVAAAQLLNGNGNAINQGGQIVSQTATAAFPPTVTSVNGPSATATTASTTPVGP
jgi:hypothetical protein